MPVYVYYVYVCIYCIHLQLNLSVTYQQTNTVVTVHVYTLVCPVHAVSITVQIKQNCMTLDSDSHLFTSIISSSSTPVATKYSQFRHAGESLLLSSPDKLRWVIEFTCIHHSTYIHTRACMHTHTHCMLVIMLL